MNRILIIIQAIVICLGFHCCKSNNKIHRDSIVGSWKSDIRFDHFSGEEYIVLNADNQVEVMDSLEFKMTDARFDVTMGCYLSYRGEWKLINDSLMVNFAVNSIRSGVDMGCFRITANKAESNNIELENCREDFSSDLSKVITAELKSRIESMCGSWMFLGNVSFEQGDLMTLSNNGNTSVYIRYICEK